MKDRRLPKLIKTVVDRFPGVRGRVEPWACPGDPSFRAWVQFFFVRPRDRELLQAFSRAVAHELFGPRGLPFGIEIHESRRSKRVLAEYAARRRFLARARKSFLRREAALRRKRRSRGALTATTRAEVRTESSRARRARPGA